MSTLHKGRIASVSAENQPWVIEITRWDEDTLEVTLVTMDGRKALRGVDPDELLQAVRYVTDQVDAFKITEPAEPSHRHKWVMAGWRYPAGNSDPINIEVVECCSCGATFSLPTGG